MSILRGLPRSLLIDAIVCRVCDQRPWRVEGYADEASLSYAMRAWCHGTYRRWLIEEEIIAAENWTALARALIAFLAMPVALPPMLMSIRRLRGRRLPLPMRDRVTVWLMESRSAQEGA